MIEKLKEAIITIYASRNLDVTISILKEEKKNDYIRTDSTSQPDIERH